MPKREVTEFDLRAPEFQRRDIKPEDYEFRDDGKVVRKDRWEMTVHNIVSILGWSRHEFELPDVVAEVRRRVDYGIDGDEEYASWEIVSPGMTAFDRSLAFGARREALAAALMRFGGYDKGSARTIAGNLIEDADGVMVDAAARPQCWTCNDYRTVFRRDKWNMTEPCPTCSPGEAEYLSWVPAGVAEVGHG